MSNQTLRTVAMICAPALLVEALLRRAGLPDVRFHDLRHTCATLLLGKGTHVKLVQELLGQHSTEAVTLDTYSHVLPGMGDGLADTMDETLG